MVRGCASRSLVARVATPFKRVRDTVSPAPGLWTEGEMRKGVDRRRRVRAHLERVNLFAAGIDVGSRSHFVAVPEDLDAEPVREFAAFTGDLHRLADWLVSLGIVPVAIESIGVYWLELYAIPERRGLEVLQVGARHVRQVRGRTRG